jgi:hypothetical protein
MEQTTQQKTSRVMNREGKELIKLMVKLWDEPKEVKRKVINAIKEVYK